MYLLHMIYEKNHPEEIERWMPKMTQILFKREKFLTLFQKYLVFCIILVLLICLPYIEYIVKVPIICFAMFRQSSPRKVNQDGDLLNRKSRSVQPSSKTGTGNSGLGQSSSSSNQRVSNSLTEKLNLFYCVVFIYNGHLAY